MSCIIGSITSLLSATGLIFYIFGNRVFMLQFIEKIGRGWGLGGRKKHLAPFVAVLLGWETGLAKVRGAWGNGVGEEWWSSGANEEELFLT